MSPADRRTFPTSRLTENEIEDGWTMCTDPDCQPTFGGHRVSGPHAHAWNGLCAAGRHGLDYEGQHCDLCSKMVR